MMSGLSRNQDNNGSRFNRTNGRRGAQLALLVILLLALAACSSQDVGLSELETTSILVKNSETASTTKELKETTVSGVIYIVVDTRPLPTDVRFFVDDMAQSGLPLTTVTASPFELAFDTTTVPDGEHTVTVVVTRVKGKSVSTTVEHASFTVQNVIDSPVVEVVPEVTGVVVSPEGVSIKPGNTVLLTAEVETVGNADESVVWSSYDKDLVTVDSHGVVTGIGEGSAGITATSVFDSTKFSTVTVTVAATAPEPDVLGVVVSPEVSSIDMGVSVALYASVDAVGGADASVSWSSSDESIASVDFDGVVTGIGPGSVDIRATSKFDDSKSATATITVTVSESVRAVNRVVVSPEDASVEVGLSVLLSAAVDVVGGADGSVVWTSSNDSSAAVDSNGLVTAIAEGVAEITATSVFDGSISGSVSVSVVGGVFAPAPEIRSFSLRGDPSFDESSLTDEALLWYRRLWAAIEHPDQKPNGNSQVYSGSLRSYGYTQQQYMMYLFTGLRATGDMKFVDEIARLSDIMASKLTTKWYNPDTNTWYSPTDGTQGYRRWVYLRNNDTHDRVGKDTDRISVYKTHAWVAMMAYMFELNREEASPRGVDYGAKADFWLHYLKSDFEAIWHIRQGTSHPQDFFKYSSEVGASTLSSQLAYHFYMYKLTGSSKRLDHANAEAKTFLEAMYVSDTSWGPTMVFSQRVRDHDAGLAPILYARYSWPIMVDLTLEGHPMFADSAILEMHARSLAYLVLDNGSIDMSFDVGGMVDRVGTDWLNGSKTITIPTLSTWDTSSVSVDRTTTHRYIDSYIAPLAAFGERQQISKTSMMIYEDREADLNNPGGLAIPTGMLLAEMMRR